MKYGFTILIVQDNPLDQKKMISKLLETASKNSDEDAGIVVGPADLETLDDLEKVDTNG
jgi:hypothetical protein